MSSDIHVYIRKGYARLIGLKGNIPGDDLINLKYAEEFNKALDQLKQAGADVDDFRITQDDWTDNYGWMIASALLRSRVDAVLTYFKVSSEPTDLPDRKIGFEGPTERT
jgi:hypothetical protein